MKAIKTEALTKFYGQNRGIVGLNLEVEQGDFYGFIGPNGAGKSTAIRLLLGLINPTEGSAEVLGKNITESREEILSCVGYLPSEAIFYKGMKVSEILTFSAKMRKKDCTSEAKILCERLELDTTKRVEELSFGNRKKLGIICAIQHNPELYILDEPTSGLDPLMQKEFYTILKEKNEQGATVFLSSHVLSEVQKYCKNAGIIRKGRLLTSGSIASLGHTGIKRVFLRGADIAPEIPEIKDLKTDGDMMSFLYSGDVNKLLAKLSAVKIADLNITDPELDEVFMHYYTGGEN